MVALERLGEIGLIEFAATAPLDLERGRVGRKALNQSMAHGVDGLEANIHNKKEGQTEFPLAPLSVPSVDLHYNRALMTPS